jgi:hypothetical protein
MQTPIHITMLLMLSKSIHLSLYGCSFRMFIQKKTPKGLFNLYLTHLLKVLYFMLNNQ